MCIEVCPLVDRVVVAIVIDNLHSWVILLSGVRHVGDRNDAPLYNAALVQTDPQICV